MRISFLFYLLVGAPATAGSVFLLISLSTASAFAGQPSSLFGQLRQQHHRGPPTLPTLPTLLARSSSSSSLYMVSKKDKKNKQQAKQKTSNLEQLEVLRQQKLLVTELKQLSLSSSSTTTTTTSSSTKHVTAAARKLLKQTAHDGLVDIGTEGRSLALELFYRADRPNDVVALLLQLTSKKSVPNDDDDDDERGRLQDYYHELGLWGYGRDQEWKSAAEYAKQLYEYGSSTVVAKKAKAKSKSSLFSTPNEREMLRQYAIQAFCSGNERKDLEHARALLQPTVDGPEIVNAVLQSYLQSGYLEEARSFWAELLQEPSSSTANAQTCRLGLECGAKLGDAALIQQALSLLGEARTASDLFLVLESLVVDAPEVPLELSLQSFLVDTYQAIMMDEKFSDTKEGKQVRKRMLRPEMFSSILLALDKPALLKKVLERFRNANDILPYLAPLTAREFWMSLRPAAKMHILPFLVFNDGKVSEEDAQAKQAMALHSLLALSKTTKRLDSFIKEQSQDFHAAAFLVICNNWKDDALQSDIANAILLNHWQSLVFPPSNDTFFSQDRKRTLGLVFSALDKIQFPAGTPLLEAEAIKINIFQNVTEALVNEIAPHQKQQQHQQGEDRPVLFSNPKIDTIVDCTIRLIDAVKIASLPTDHYQYRTVATASIAAMLLIAKLCEFSVETFVERGGEKLDNDEPRKAFETIVKKVLVTGWYDKLFESTIAAEYYFALATVARTWSNEDDLIDLLFSCRATTIWKDPFETFRNLVTGEEIKNSKVDLLQRVLNWADSFAFGELSELLPSVTGMAQQTGTRDDFVARYQQLLVEDYDVFLSRPMKMAFCTGLLEARRLQEATKEAYKLHGLKEDDLSVYFQVLWNQELIEKVIVKQARCEHVKYWVNNGFFYGGPRDKLSNEIFISTGYLWNMYSCVVIFSRLDSNGDKAFVAACRKNMDFLLEHLMEKGLYKSNKSKPKSGRGRKRASSWEDFYPHFKTVARGMILAMDDQIIIDEAGDLVDIPDLSTFSDGSTTEELFIRDVLWKLNTFHDLHPSEWISDISLEDLKIRPEISNMINKWAISESRKQSGV